MARNYIMDAELAHRKMERMAYEVLEENLDEDSLILVGIKENGRLIAREMHRLLSEIGGKKIDLIDLEIDKKQPGDVTLSASFDFRDRVILVVDDVANSGKTLLYSLKPFLDYHPKKIQTLVLVERSHKLFPIQPDFVGLSIATTLQDHIFVEASGEKITGAYLQ
jgi:pyrimidine operon attenuation protein / uracil phosphoribosyltransferase